MKNKFLLLLVAVVLSISYSVAQVARTVDVTTPGTLATLIDADKLTITDLTVTGTVDASDFAAFKGMTALKNLDLSAMNITDSKIPDAAFQSFQLNELKLPVSVKSIGKKAFEKATLSQGLTFPASLQIVKEAAFGETQVPFLDFSKCSDLSEVEVWSFYATKIGNKTLDLSKCVSLNKFGETNYHGFEQGPFVHGTYHITLPENLTVLPNRALAQIWGSVDLPKNLTEIGEYGFWMTKTTKEIILPPTLKSIGKKAFEKSTLSHGLTFPASLQIVKEAAFGETLVPFLDFSKCSDLSEVEVWSFYATKIGNKTLDLSKCVSLNKFGETNYHGFEQGPFVHGTYHITLPENLTVLPNRALAQIWGSVDLPKNLTEIGEYGFWMTKTTKEIIFPPTLKSIGKKAFEKSTLSHGLTFPASLQIVKEAAFGETLVPFLDFSKCSDLSEVEVWSFYATKIGNKTLDLSKCVSLNKFGETNYHGFEQGPFVHGTYHITLPENLTVLPNRALAQIWGSVDLPKNLTEIGEYGFWMTKTTKEIILPPTLKSIGKKAFEKSTLSHGLTFPASLQIVKEAAFGETLVPFLDFSKCSNLSGVEVWSFYATKIGNKTLDLSKCVSLNKFGGINYHGFEQGPFVHSTYHLTLPENLTVLPNRALAQIWGSVDLPTSLTQIQDMAFWMAQIKEIKLPASVNYIGSNTFHSCNLLQEIHSANLVPPALGVNVFNGVNKTTCKLIVSASSLPLYTAANQWKDFLNVDINLDRSCFTIQVKDLDSGKLIKGGKYRVIGNNYDQTFNATSENGIEIMGLHLGQYVITELEAPLGYYKTKLTAPQVVVLCSTECQTISFANEKNAEPATFEVQTRTATSNASLYPNPVKDVLNIRSDVEVKLIEIYGTNGNLAVKDNSGASQINVSHLPSGMYVVKVHTGVGIQTHKIIKE